MTLEERLENFDKKLLLVKDTFDVAMECVKDTTNLEEWYFSTVKELDKNQSCLRYMYYALDMLSEDEYSRMEFMVDTYEEYITSKYKRKKKEMEGK